MSEAEPAAGDRGGPDFYARPSLNVETYDLRAERDIVGTSVDGDADFFAELAARIGGPILELGCGTGRIAWRLAGTGHEVVGLDRSAAMLERAEAKRAIAGVAAWNPTFVEGDMAEFDLGRLFRLVIVPYRAFQALLEPELQRSCLAAVRRHLDDGGRLVLDLFDPRLEWCLPIAAGSPRPVRETVRHPESKRQVTIEVVSRSNDPFRQVFDEMWRFRELDVDGSVVREEHERLSLRWTYRFEVRYLLELAGFEVEASYGDFHGSPPAYGREQVWVARPRR